MNPPGIVATMNAAEADVIVLSACQMPSLPAMPMVEAQSGKAVVTAAIATTWQVLRALEIDTRVPACFRWVPIDARL